MPVKAGMAPRAGDDAVALALRYPDRGPTAGAFEKAIVFPQFKLFLFSTEKSSNPHSGLDVLRIFLSPLIQISGKYTDI